MRVTAVIKSLGPGGAEQLLVEFARCAPQVNIDLRVVSLLAQKRHLVGALEAAGAKVHCIGVNGLSEFRWVRELVADIRSSRPDVLHTHSPALAPFVRLAAHAGALGRPRPVLATTEHNVWTSYRRPTRVANRLTAALDDLAVTVSDEVRRSLPTRRIRERATVVHHGIDLAGVRASADRRSASRASLGLADDDIVVATVANYRTQKNYPNLLAAASAASAVLPNLRFIAVGQGPLQSVVEAEHRRLGLGDRMMLLGMRTDVPDVLAAADVFALASDYEGLPVALMEAMALGLPVVATAVGGVAEVVGPDIGRLVPPRDAPALAAAIVAVCSDANLRQRLGDGSRAASATFDAVTTANALTDLFEGALARRRRR